MNDDLKSSPQEVLEDYFRLFNEIGIINQLSSNRAERVLPHGLTLSQFSVLNHFARGLPAKSPLGLANAFQVTKAAMTNTIGQLHKKGFVEVTPHPQDGRSKIVSISKAGLAAHHDARQNLKTAFPDFVEAFDIETLRKILPELEQIRVWLDENRP